MQTIDQLIRDREGDTRVGLAFSDRTWTHAEVVRAQAERAALLLSLRQPGPSSSGAIPPTGATSSPATCPTRSASCS